jgi:cation diffusion facilitator family transporter
MKIVAMLQIRVGRRIASEAMIADGLHARTDGLTSLAVLVAAGGAALGFPILDPIIGIVIGVTIVFITRDATIAIWHRLMDAVDPNLTIKAEKIIGEHPDVRRIHRLQLRWLGHELYAEIVLELDSRLSLIESETILDHVRHHLYHDLPRLSKATLSALPYNPEQPIHSQESEHHRMAAETV